jgi:hypothetical protein
LSTVLLVFAGGPPPSVSVMVTAQTSTPMGMVPAPPGTGQGQGGPNTWFYEYTIPDGSSIVDSIPIYICVVNSPNDNGTGYPLTLTFAPGAGGNLPGVGLPSDPGFSSNGCQTIYISLNTGPLAAGDYSKNINIQKGTATPSNTNFNGLNTNGGNIHIQVHVLEAQDPLSCFMTSSSFAYLQDCSGNLITSGADGRFTIVKNNKNIEVATNPGQFYYNAVWTNTTGSDRLVTVTFSRTGVNWHGANAIHALLFAPPFSGVSTAGFAAVNSGIPSGHDDTLESINVPNGWTLWVDYHLTWAGLGLPVPSGIATTCPTANQIMSVTATVSYSGGPDVCTAGAFGYRK